MKCERCGHQLDNDDLFCPKCGKAVFEEYMDEDDIWEYYKPDEVLKEEAMKHAATQAAAAEDDAPETPELRKEAGVPETPEADRETGAPETPEADRETGVPETPEADREAGAPETPEAHKEADVPETSEPDIETDAARAQGKTAPFVQHEDIKAKSVKKKAPVHMEKQEKKSPAWLISGCVLVVCLLLGILWGIRTVQDMDKEKQEYYAGYETEEKPASDAAAEPAPEDSTLPQEESQSTDASEETQDTPPEETKEEEKKQEHFNMVDAGEIDFSQYKKIAVKSADQNSQSRSDKYDYSARSAVDGDRTSSWQEGEEGIGEGAGIQLGFDGSHKVRYMVLYLGNWRSDDMWTANARPASLTIRVGDTEKIVEFPNEKKAFCLSFDEPVEASDVSLFIKSGYAGDRWNDNCISEVEIYE